jgi:hypothetical protein
MENKSFTKILAYIGSVIIFIDAILTLLGFFGITIPALPGWGFWSSIFPGWINTVVLIVIAVVIFFSVDIIQGFRVSTGGLWLLILGIVSLVFSAYYIGAVLVIIAAILWLFGKR